MEDSACHCHYRGYTEDADYVVIGKNKFIVAAEMIDSLQPGDLLL